MLFDLRGKRKRMIQVIYVALALLMGGGLVLFGIGGGTSGGLLDAVKGGHGSAGFGRDIERYRKRLKLHPRDRPTLLALSRAYFQEANSGGNVDQQSGGYSDQGQKALDSAVGAWERYLKTSPPRPSVGGALLAVRGYDALRDYRSAAKTQRIVATSRPSRGSQLQLASYLYYSNQFAGGDKVAARALARAKGAERKAIEQQLQLLKFGQQALNFYLHGKVKQGDAAAEKAIAAVPADQRSALRGRVKRLKKQAAQFRKLNQAAKQQTPPPTPGAAPQNPFAFPSGGGAGGGP